MYRLTSEQLEWLKWVAIIAMLIDHSCKILLPINELLYPWGLVFGRIAFPFFAFVMAYNLLHHVRDKSKYTSRLFILALISQAPLQFAFQNIFLLNIFFTLSLGSLLVWGMELCREERTVKRLSFLAIGLFLTLIIGPFVDYSTAGILAIPCFYLFLQERRSVRLFYLLCSILFVAAGQINIYMALFAMIPFVLLLLVPTWELTYVRRLPKWFYYAFYPVHLIVLGVVALLVQG